VLAYRIPLHISFISKRSFCPHCKKNIGVFSLIPVLGYLFVGGRCQHCKAEISWQYPFVELLVGTLTTFLFFKPIIFGTNFEYSFIIVPLFASLWLLYSGTVLSIIDIRHGILPDVIVLPGIVVGFLISCFNPQVGWSASLLGILIGSGGLFLISKLFELLRKKEGMGMGDIKYLGFLGAVLGPHGIIFTLVIASILGSVYGIVLGILNKRGLSTTLPFGPFLALGAFLVNVVGLG